MRQWAFESGRMSSDPSDPWCQTNKDLHSLTPITVDVIDAVVEGEEEVQELEETQEEILDAAKPVEMQGQGAQVAARAGKACDFSQRRKRYLSGNSILESGTGRVRVIRRM